MRIEYDPDRDLLYIWFAKTGVKAAETITVAPGVHVDMDASGKLVGLEVLEAETVLGKKVQFEVTLPSTEAIQVSGD